MTPAEAAVLLAHCAAFDNRTAGEAQARAWAEALPGVALDDARRAVVEHYRDSTEWCKPAHVNARVRAMRAQRISNITRPAPPVELSPQDDLTWGRLYMRAIGDGADDTAAQDTANRALGITPPAAVLVPAPTARLRALAATAATIPDRSGGDTPAEWA
ncbi:hypothetical protein [Georgenia yuyongxinii]